MSRRQHPQTATVAPALPPLTTCPPGYALLPWSGMWRPVLVLTSGDGLWSAPVYRELSLDGRTGAVCASQAEALGVIAAHQAWRKRQDEMERVKAKGQKGGQP